MKTILTLTGATSLFVAGLTTTDDTHPLSTSVATCDADHNGAKIIDTRTGLVAWQTITQPVPVEAGYKATAVNPDLHKDRLTVNFTKGVCSIGNPASDDNLSFRMKKRPTDLVLTRSPT